MKKSKNEYYEGIMESLSELKDYLNGDKTKGRSFFLTVPECPSYQKAEIKQTREELGLTQSNFALALGVSVKTVEAWEAGRNIPQGSSQRLIGILKKGGRKFMQEYGLLTVYEPQNTDAIR